MTDEPADRAPFAGRALLLVLVAGFFAHRLYVVLSAGDFLYPLEPSEAKNTQIAWDLFTGRFGTDGFELHNYVVNNGSIHHASYSSAALAYWLSSKFFGFTLLSVRMVPLVAWTGALLLWGETVRRRFGVVAMALSVAGLFLVPTLFLAFQLTFLGCHPESVLPLAAAVLSWLTWLDRPTSPVTAAVFGLCAAYAAIFSYLLWPFLALMGALTLLPPWPRAPLRTVGAGIGGAVLGLWPLWLIVALGGLGVLLGSPITENPDTTLTETAKGMGLDWEEFRVTFTSNLPAGFNDYWMSHPEAPRLDRFDLFLEEVAYRVLVFGSLLLLPWALTDRDPQTRRLGILAAVAPPLVYAWLCFASPWKPHVPVRYFIPFALFGFSAPGLAVGLGIRRLMSPGWTRWLGLPAIALGVGWLVIIAPHRWHEAADVVRTERTEALLEHRYVTYYNLGVGTVWAQMVDDLNDLVDVTAASDDPDAFDGLQAGLWGWGGRLALGRREWEPPVFEAKTPRSGLREWGERDGYRNADDRDNPERVAFNVGWGMALRARWQLGDVAGALAKLRADGDWPERLPTDRFWEGVGFGYGRSQAEGTRADAPEALSPTERESFAHGVQAGRELGEVPAATTLPPEASVRGPAT